MPLPAPSDDPEEDCVSWLLSTVASACGVAGRGASCVEDALMVDAVAESLFAFESCSVRERGLLCWVEDLTLSDDEDESEPLALLEYTSVCLPSNTRTPQFVIKLQTSYKKREKKKKHTNMRTATKSRTNTLIPVL